MRLPILVVVLFFIFLASEGYTQQNQSAEYNKKDGGTSSSEVVLIVSLDGMPKYEQRNLKAELLSYDEKVTYLNFDELTQILKVAHNEDFQKNEMLAILKKYGVNKSAITSYK